MDATKTDTFSNVNSVECLFQTLYIDKKPKKKTPLASNPFAKNRILKRTTKNALKTGSKHHQKCFARVSTVQLDNELAGEQSESKLMSDITEKMAKIWNESGYRELKCKRKPTAPSNVELVKQVAAEAEAKTMETSAENVDNFSSQTCARQALYDYCDSSVTELAAYLDETLYIPRKMSFMAEMMYT